MPIVLYSNQNNAQAVDTETCPTLPAAMGMGGYVPMIVEPYILELDTTIKVGGRCVRNRRDKTSACDS